jgi:hypothetical protein
LERALVEWDRAGFEAGVGACAGPGPVEWVGDEAGGDGVVGEVAVEAEQVGVVVDAAGEAVGAEEVGAALVAAVVPAGVLGVAALLERLSRERTGSNWNLTSSDRPRRDEFCRPPPSKG